MEASAASVLTFRVFRFLARPVEHGGVNAWGFAASHWSVSLHTPVRSLCVLVDLKLSTSIIIYMTILYACASFTHVAPLLVAHENKVTLSAVLWHVNVAHYLFKESVQYKPYTLTT